MTCHRSSADFQDSDKMIGTGAQVHPKLLKAEAYAELNATDTSSDLDSVTSQADCDGMTATRNRATAPSEPCKTIVMDSATDRILLTAADCEAVLKLLDKSWFQS